MTDKSLTSFVEEVCGESHLRVEDDFGDGFVRLLSSEAEKRQAQHDIRSTEDIIIEMLRNARDANASNIFVATSKEGSLRRIVMIDDGDGIPQAMHEKIFEPRVTSKLDTVHMDTWGIHGRGMALFSIASNADKAYISTSEKNQGAAIVVESNTLSLPEKTDQSSFPIAMITDEGKVSFKGPRNIHRTMCEFAFTHRKECSVYCGSPTDIAATLYAFGEATISKNIRLFGGDPDEYAFCKRLCFAGDPHEFIDLAKTVGLDISERSARRIMDGTIVPLSSLYELIARSVLEQSQQNDTVDAGKQKKKRSKTKGLKIASEDMEEFTDAIQKAFSDIADKYYLDADDEPSVRVKGDFIRIDIPFNKID